MSGKPILRRAHDAPPLFGGQRPGGVLAGPAQFNPVAILMKAVRVQGVFVGSRAMFEEMNAFITAKGIKPVIDRVFPFAEAVAAFRHLESGSHFGKVVVKVR